MPVEIVSLKQNGSIEELVLKNASSSSITNALKTKSESGTKPSYIGCVPHSEDDESFIHFFGYTTGSEETESKHQLPPPFDDTQIFGTCFVLKSTSDTEPTLMNELKNMNVAEFEGVCEGLMMDDDDDSELNDDEQPEEDDDQVPDEPDDIPDEDDAVVIPKSTTSKNKKKSTVVHIPLYETDTTITPVQQNVINLLKKFLNDSDSENTEHSIFVFSIQESKKNGIQPAWTEPAFVQYYASQARKVLLNIDPDSYIQNTTLIEQLKSGKIDPATIPFLTPEQLCPSRWNDIISRHTDKEKSLYDKNNLAGVLVFCRRCKKKTKCTFYQQQTRSADEPMTSFWTCLECSAEWRT